MIKNILFIGNYGNRNVGDNAILEELIKKYRKEFKKSKIYIICRENIREVKKLRNVIPVKMTAGEMTSVFLGSNMVVVGGGGIFSEYVGPKAKYIPLVTITAKLMGKRVHYDSLGFYPSTSKILTTFVRIAFILSDFISVRDHVSLEMCGWVRKYKNISLVDDPAITLKAIKKQRATEILKKENIDIGKRKLVGISIKRVKNSYLAEKVSSVFEELLRRNSNSNLMFLFIPYSRDKGGKRTEDDAYYCNKIVNKCSNSNVYILQNEYTPSEILGITKLLDLSICMRFHSIVFAKIAGISFVPISYAEKCHAYLSKINTKELKIKNISYRKIADYGDIGRKLLKV